MLADGLAASLIGLTTNFGNSGHGPCFRYTQMCLCNGGETFGVNTLFGDSNGENLWLDLNRDTQPHVYF
jgi:hypothetical protein